MLAGRYRTAELHSYVGAIIKETHGASSSWIWLQRVRHYAAPAVCAPCLCFRFRRLVTLQATAPSEVLSIALF